MNFETILELLKTIIDSYITNLNLEQLAYAIAFAIFGLVVSMLARRITRILLGRNDVDDDNKLMIGIKLFGIVVFFVGLLIVVIQSI